MGQAVTCSASCRSGNGELGLFRASLALLGLGNVEDVDDFPGIGDFASVGSIPDAAAEPAIDALLEVAGFDELLGFGSQGAVTVVPEDQVVGTADAVASHEADGDIKGLDAVVLARSHSGFAVVLLGIHGCRQKDLLACDVGPRLAVLVALASSIALATSSLNSSSWRCASASSWVRASFCRLAASRSAVRDLMVLAID